MPGATLSVKVPKGSTDVALIRFSSQAAVQDGIVNGISARALVDGIEATPQISEPWLFPAGPSHGTTYVEREAVGLAAGRHTVTIQVAPASYEASCSAEIAFDGWTLTAESWKQTP
ncbi:MAG TPA: hypothetical protein VH914_00505 [Acidimicrobiia bacterium]|nr:hypothetical protein [Acidimicrobiia bacterium]